MKRRACRPHEFWWNSGRVIPKKEYDWKILGGNNFETTHSFLNMEIGVSLNFLKTYAQPGSLNDFVAWVSPMWRHTHKKTFSRGLVEV